MKNQSITLISTLVLSTFTVLYNSQCQVFYFQHICLIFKFFYCNICIMLLKHSYNVSTGSHTNISGVIQTLISSVFSYEDKVHTNLHLNNNHQEYPHLQCLKCILDNTGIKISFKIIISYIQLTYSIRVHTTSDPSLK